MKFPLVALLLSSIAFTRGYSQGTDTFRVMQYNLLNYADVDNPVSYKNPRLQTIINHVSPDIFGANEIARGSQNPGSLLNNVLGADWEMGSYMNTRNSLQANMLFWKKSKFGLSGQRSIVSQTRDIIAFKLYYKDAGLAQTHDTTFLTVIVAHLKAGSYAQDSLDRIAETAVVANYLNGEGPGNYLFMGDMNVYTASEGCYQNLVGGSNAATKLYDPVNRPGRWNGNSSFADIHSQSTRKVALSDGGVTGGLDDRFDQILISGPVKDNGRRIQYLASSYKVIGQDGNHFNKGLLDNPANSSVPSTVLQALYEMSDHLPVTAKFVVQKTTQGTAINGPEGPGAGRFSVINPLDGHTLQLHCKDAQADGTVQVGLYGLSGTTLLRSSWNTQRSADFRVMVPGLTPGLYLLQLKNAEGLSLLRTLVLVR